MKRIEGQIFDYTLNLEINESLTLITGDSAVGKTLIFNYIDRQSFINKQLKCINIQYTEKLRKNNERLENTVYKQIKGCKNSLVVIDNADVLLGAKTRQYIIFDSNNTYVLFGRNVNGLWITEANIANLIRDDKNKRLYLDYIFKDVNKA